MINLYLNEFGACESEIGFASIKNEANYINANIELAEKGVLRPIHLRGWVWAVKKEVEHALERTGLKHYHISAPLSDGFVTSRMDQEWNFSKAVDDTVECIEYAKRNGVKSVTIGANDSARVSEDKLIEFSLKMKECGAGRIRYCDTWGWDTPSTIYRRVRLLAEKVEIPVEVHVHNDRGALDAGVDCYVTTTVNGYGERAGNADLLSVALNLKKGQEFLNTGVLDPRVDLTKLRKLAFYASFAFGLPIPPDQVGTGSNVFIKPSRFHVDGALQEVADLPVFDLEELGHSEPEIIETGRWITSGGTSGIKGFRNTYGKLEILFGSEEEGERIIDLIRYANEHNHAALTVDELRFIARYTDIAEKILKVMM
jgi:homocitrate synthase NifV